MARTKMAPPRTGSKGSTGKAQGKKGRHDKTQDDDLEDPGSCFCETIRGGDVVSCNFCQRWCHPSCVGLSTMMFKVMSESEAPYLCPLCVLLRFSKEDSTTQGRSAIKADIQRITSEFQTIKESVDRLTEQVKGLSNASSSLSASKNTHGRLKLEQVASTMREQEKRIKIHDRQLRSKNIVIYGLDEEDSHGPVRQFRSMLSDKLGMESEQVSIIEAFRLGKKGDSNIRPVLVKLRDVQCKVDIMNKCHLLKGSGIFINNDYTTLQRRNMRALVARMKEAKNDGYSNVYITRRGVLMVDGIDMGSVDAMELKLDVENEI